MTQLDALLAEARRRGVPLSGYDPLGELHLALSDDRLGTGRYYTPEPLVRFLWSLLPGRPATVLDPACGSGRLLVEARRRGARVVGVDPDGRALAIARRALPDAELHEADALSEAADLPPVDLLVANPPYGRRAPDRYVRETVAPFAFPEHWFAEVPLHERNRGKLADHCAWFVALCDRRVRPGGTIALITTNAWLSIPTWRFLRRHVLERWTLDMLVDFNRPSDRRSVFLPDAAIAACVLVARRAPPPSDHRVRVLDLSARETVRERYEAIGRCVWEGEPRGHRALRSFEPRPVEALPWEEVPQAAFLAQPDHRLRRPTPLVEAVERDWVRLSSLAATHPGVDPGDLRHLVAPDPEALRQRLEPILAGRLDALGRTARAWIAGNLDHIGGWDPDHVVPFLFQKDARPFGYRRLHVTWLHPRVLWRARLRDGGGPILARRKLVVLERRERGEVVALVTNRLLVPQHGGRLLYLTDLPDDVMHALCAVLNAPTYQRYFREAGQGDKDLRVPDPARLDPAALAELAEASRRLHAGAGDIGRVDRIVCNILPVDRPARGRVPPTDADARRRRRTT